MNGAWNAVGRYGTVGFELVITVGLLTFGGHWLDDRFLGGHGWGLGTGFVFGVVVAFRNLLRTAGRMERDIEREEAKHPGEHWNVDPTWLHKDQDHDPSWVHGNHDDPGWPPRDDGEGGRPGREKR